MNIQDIAGDQVVMLRHGQHGIVKGDITTVRGRCTLSGELLEVDVPTKELAVWVDGLGVPGGPLIQNAMPSAPAEVRDFLISGCGPDAFEKAFRERTGRRERER